MRTYPQNRRRNRLDCAVGEGLRAKKSCGYVFLWRICLIDWIYLINRVVRVISEIQLPIFIKRQSMCMRSEKRVLVVTGALRCHQNDRN